MDTELTKAEKRIAAGYVDGLIGKEIADRCGISYNTVVSHTQHIYEKAGIRQPMPLWRGFLQRYTTLTSVS